MSDVIRDVLTELQLGEVRRHRSLSVVPILGGDPPALEYLSLSQAFEQQLVVVGEVSKCACDA